MTETTDHEYLDLHPDRDDEMDRNCHQPNLSIYIEYPDEEEKEAGTEESKVVMHLDAQWGQPQRWAEMTDDQARRLAVLLVRHADMIDSGTFEQV